MGKYRKKINNSKKQREELLLSRQIDLEFGNQVSHVERKCKKYAVINTKMALKKNINIQKYKIPKEKFDRALKILKSSNIAEPDKCLIPVHLINDKKYELVKCPFSRLLAQARICLLKRDWMNLAKVLSAAKPINRLISSMYYPIFVQYAAICLKYNENDPLLDIFLRGVLSCHSPDERMKFWQSLTTIKFDLNPGVVCTDEEPVLTRTSPTQLEENNAI